MNLPIPHRKATVPNDPASLSHTDRRIVSRALNYQAPWLDPAEPVTLCHLIRAAGRNGDREEIAARLTELGYVVPPAGQLASVTDDDAMMISRDGDGLQPWITPEDHSFRGHVLSVARRLELPPAVVAARLAELDFPAPDPGSFPDEITDADRDLARRRDGGGRWIADDDPVPLVHVLAALERQMPKKPQEAASAIVAACERLGRLGYRVDPGAAEVTADDVLLVSRELDGQAPWLPAGDEPVPLHHVLRFAQAHDRDPNEVAARLGRLGHHRLPEGPLVDSVTGEETELLGHGWGGGGRTWLAQDDPDRFPHLVAAGAATGKAPAEIARRLRTLGFTVPEEELPARTTESDRPLISGRTLAGAGNWLSRTQPVPVGHILHNAHARGASTASVLARLTELGYSRLPAIPDLRLTDDDLLLISERGDGSTPVLGDTVPYGRLVRAAAATGTGPREAAVRYRELGYTDVVLPEGPLPDSVTEGDADLIATDTGWLAPDETVPVPFVVRRAHAEGIGPAGIVRRLRALGFHDVPDGLPDTPHPADLVMISEDAKPGGDLLPLTGVSAYHILRAAHRADVSPYDISRRLIALGYTPEVAPHPDDEAICSANGDGRAPWPWGSEGLGHTLLLAKVLGRTPQDVNARRAALGYGERELPDAGGFEDGDMVLLSENLDARGPWLRWGTDPSWKHVLRAARITGRDPRQIAERLRLLGHAADVPSALRVDDLVLLEVMPDDPRSADTAEVLSVATRTGRSPAEVAARLRELDIEVPDLDYPTRRPAPRTPRAGRSV